MSLRDYTSTTLKPSTPGSPTSTSTPAATTAAADSDCSIATTPPAPHSPPPRTGSPPTPPPPTAKGHPSSSRAEGEPERTAVPLHPVELRRSPELVQVGVE